LFVVQARPITSLFPLPEPRPKDPGLHVYLSFGHAQVMTDPMPPMALSIWRTVFPFGRNDETDEPNPFMATAGNRLYLDPTPLLRIPFARRALPRLLSIADQAISDAVAEVVSREDFEQGARDAAGRARLGNLLRWLFPIFLRVPARLFITPPEGATASLWQHFAAYIESETHAISQAPQGVERLRAARRVLMGVFEHAIWIAPPLLVASILAGKILKALVHDETTARDLEALVRGLEGNVTTEMDLAVGDLADAVRKVPALVARLGEGKAALEGVESLEGGEAFMKAWRAFLSRYGMRGPSEIDISRPRYRDDPSAVLMAVAGNLQHEAPGAHRAHHRRMAQESEAAGTRIVAAARRGVAGVVKGALVGRMVRVVRYLSPMREHPKLLLIHMLDLARQAILEAADALLAEGRIDARDDVWFLELDELIAACEQKGMNLRETIAARRADFEHFRRVSPPRVMTSEGEIVKARPRGDHLPKGALAGTAASAGVAEGRARVIIDPTREVLGAGEILVAPFTDPGWTPLFINAKALVMEVGGLMTHGSVVAREYGIPAVVSVEGATQRIKSGQRIRVDGDLGCVEILADEAAEAASSVT